MARVLPSLAIFLSIVLSLVAYLSYVPNSEGVPQMDRIRLLSASMKIIRFIVRQSHNHRNQSILVFIGFRNWDAWHSSSVENSTRQWSTFEKVKITWSQCEFECKLCLFLFSFESSSKIKFCWFRSEIRQSKACQFVFIRHWNLTRINLFQL